MKLITKEILHPDFELYHRPDRMLEHDCNKLEKYTRKELLEDIRKAKTYLLKEKNFQKGDKVLLASVFFPDFLVWFFAVLELGGSFVVSDSPSFFFKIVQHRLNLYGEINHFIWDRNDEPAFDFLKEKFIQERCFKNYKSSEDVSNLILADESSIVMWSTSSGTTDIPKVSSHSHQFFYDLLHRNSKIFEIKENDRCLHTKNLHHGSVLGVHLLPNLKFCKYHFWQNVGDPTQPWKESLISLIKIHRVNRCLLYHIDYLDAFQEYIQPEDFDYTIIINVLSKFSKNTVDHLVGKCNHKLVSIFGCTETSGPLFLLELTRENFRTANYYNFGKPLDDFYKIKINKNNGLEVTMPDGDMISTGDKFRISDRNYYFKGRNSGMRVKGYAIYLSLLSDVIEKYKDLNFKFGENFDLAIDSHHQKIYMRSDFSIDLNDINEYLLEKFTTDAYNISYIMIAKREDFIYGIKFDSEKFRILCRQALDLSNF